MNTTVFEQFSIFWPKIDSAKIYYIPKDDLHGSDYGDISKTINRTTIELRGRAGEIILLKRVAVKNDDKKFITFNDIRNHHYPTNITTFFNGMGYFIVSRTIPLIEEWE